MKKIIGIFIVMLLISSALPISVALNNRYKIINQNIFSIGPIPPSNIFMGYNVTNSKNQVIIEDVPCYIWYNGCCPTSAGMLLGYWDLNGFSNLVDGSAKYQNQNGHINQMISHYLNYVDYCLPKDSSNNILRDKSELPIGDEHEDNCLADFMKTSQSYHNLWYGATWPKDVMDGIEDYVDWKCSEYKAIGKYYSGLITLSWDKYCSEIDLNHPVLLGVDTDGNGYGDHKVIGIGYDYDKHLYACYNTWDFDIHWYEFAEVDNGQDWGIQDANTIFFTNAPNKPETPIGPTNGKPDDIIEFSSSTVDIDGDKIYYKWDWGDNKSTNWLGPYESGEAIFVNYSWSDRGSYNVSVKAKDKHGAEGEWSDPLFVSMPKNKSISNFNPWFSRLIERFPILKLLL